MDLTVEAESFGARIAFSDDADDIRQLQVPSLKAGRIPQYLKANLLAAKAIAQHPTPDDDRSTVNFQLHQRPKARHIFPVWE